MSTLVGARESNAEDWTEWARRPGRDSYWTLRGLWKRIPRFLDTPARCAPSS